MKQLEHVLCRVRVPAPNGQLIKLTERQFAIARALAQHTGGKAADNMPRPAELGCQVSIKLVCQSSFKGHSTVSKALSELEALGVITRRSSSCGSPWATHIYTFDASLLKAAKRSRPYLGGWLIFGAQKIASNSPAKNANICVHDHLDTPVVAGFENNSAIQHLDVQQLDGDFSAEHSPPPCLPVGPLEVLVNEGSVQESAGVFLPHEGGRAVRCPDPMPPTEILRERTKFFEFLQKNDVSKFFLDAQARRKSDGKRGGMLASLLKTGGVYPRRTEGVEAGLDAMASRLAALNKRRLDLSIKAAEDSHSKHRLLLADDLDEAGSTAVTKWWRGPSIVLETSPANFQVLLIAARPLDRAERHRAQQFFVTRFESDPGASAGVQPHRYPGSPNFKGSAIQTGKPFFCRLTRMETGNGDGLEALNEALSYQHEMVSKSQIVAPGMRSQGKNSNSELAWRAALQMVREGQPDVEVLNMLTQKYLAHHDPVDWPARTLASVKFFDARRQR